jgi:hypothetical protein
MAQVYRLPDTKPDGGTGRFAAPGTIVLMYSFDVQTYPFKLLAP